MLKAFPKRKNRVLAFSLFVLILAGCQNKHDDDTSRLSKGINFSKKGHVVLECVPFSWQLGDTVWLKSKSTYAQSDASVFGAELSSPFPILESVEGETSQEYNVRVLIDSTDQIIPGKSAFELIGTFDIPPLGIGIRTKEKYLIDIDSLDHFFIRIDDDFYELDTGELAVPIFEE